MMTDERLDEIEHQLTPSGHCYECGADEYVYELIYEIRALKDAFPKVEIEERLGQPTTCKVSYKGIPVFYGQTIDPEVSR